MSFPAHPMRSWGLAFGGLALVAGLFFYLQGLAPLRRREAEARSSVAAMEARISEARRVVAEVRELEAQASRERRELAALMGSFPSGPALTWVPERMKAQFGGARGVEVVTRLNTARMEPGLPDFQRTYWAVEMLIGNATSELREACEFIADLDLEDPLLRVVNVAIRPDANDPRRRLAMITVAVLSPKLGTTR